MTSQATAYRFSGHETFSCRYAWLPKAVRALEQNPKIFACEDDAIVELGVGKNMVRAIRFWVQAAGNAVSTKDGYDLDHGHGSPGQIFKLPDDSMGCSYRRMNRRGLHGVGGQRWSCASIRRKADSFQHDLQPNLKADSAPVWKDLASAAHASAKATLAKPNRSSVGETELHPPFNMSDWGGENLRQDARGLSLSAANDAPRPREWETVVVDRVRDVGEKTHLRRGPG